MAGVGAVRGSRQQSNSGPKAAPAADTRSVRATTILSPVLEAKLRLATTAGRMTISAYISGLVARDKLDPCGRPVWADVEHVAA